MKKNDILVTMLISIYVLFLPIAPNTKIEWLLNSLIGIIGLIYIYEIATIQESRKDFFNRFKSIALDFFTIIFALFIIFMLLSTIFSTEKGASLKEDARYILYYATYLIVRFRITSSKIHEIIIKFYYASVTIVCLLGLYNFFSQNDLKKSIEYALANSNALNTSRVSATLGHPNTLSAYLVLAIFPLILQTTYTKGKNKIFFIILSLLVVVNLGLTFSRNGLLAFAIGILILSMVCSWKFVFLYAIPVAYTLVSPNILDRIKQIVNVGYNEGRLNLWRTAGKMINEHFWWGVGSGNFINQYASYIKRFPELKNYETQPLPPHNSYIRAFVEMGIFTSVIFLIMCFDMLKEVYYIKDKIPGYIKNFYNGFLISTTCFLMMNCFDDLFYVPKVTMTFFLFIFIAYTMKPLKENEKDIVKK